MVLYILSNEKASNFLTYETLSTIANLHFEPLISDTRETGIKKSFLNQLEVCQESAS